MYQFFNKFFLIVFVLSLLSCQVNNVLIPTRNSTDTREFNWKEGNDTIKLEIPQK